MNDMDQELLLLTTSINPPSATTCGEVLVGERALHPHEVILNALVLFSSPSAWRKRPIMPMLATPEPSTDPVKMHMGMRDSEGFRRKDATRIT